MGRMHTKRAWAAAFAALLLTTPGMAALGAPGSHTPTCQGCGIALWETTADRTEQLAPRSRHVERGCPLYGGGPSAQASGQAAPVSQMPGVYAPNTSGTMAPGSMGAPGYPGMTAPAGPDMGAPGYPGSAPGEPGIGAPGYPGAAAPSTDMAPPGTPPAAAPTTPGDLIPPDAVGPEAAAAAPGAGAALPGEGLVAPGGSLGEMASLSSGLGGVLGGNASSALVMFGDQGPLLRLLAARQLPIPPSPPRPTPPEPPLSGAEIARNKTLVAPYARSIKFCENMSPLPQDRIAVGFNYYDGMNESTNPSFGGLVGGMKVYRYLFTLEKTLFDGYASIGVRDSINNLSAPSVYPGLGGTTTAMGDLSIFGKVVLWENLREPSRDPGALQAAVAPVVGGLQGGILTGGLSIRTPTGPSNFAGSPFSFAPRDVGLSPYLGYYWSSGDLYVQGFEYIDIPTGDESPTMLYNDFGLGYFVYRNQEPGAWIRAIAPTFETHVNVPLNHNDLYDLRDPFATTTVVDLTYGINTVIGDRSLLSLGIVTPITGPKPFDYEVVALFNVFYGATRRNGRMTAPVLGN